MAPSSLLAVSDVHIDIIGASSTISSTIRSDDWNGRNALTWLAMPNTVPEVGDYHLRHEEECGRSDGGGYERRRHEVRHPFRFTEAAPLPSVAGNVVVSQRLSDYDVPSVEPIWTAGVCELRRFPFIAVTVDWFASPELVPFGEAVLARGGWRPDDSRFWKGYGEPLSNDVPYRRAFGSISCGPLLSTGLGFVDGRATFTLRSQLAGTQELPPISTEIQLDCPPSELVGPCFDAGPDAAIDAPNIEGGAPDAYVNDALRSDAHLDGASPNAPDGERDISSDPSTADATNPRDPSAYHGGSGCSLNKLGAERAAPSGTLLLGFLLTAVSALRRRSGRAALKHQSPRADDE